jgi:hypothetical protein
MTCMCTTGADLWEVDRSRVVWCGWYWHYWFSVTREGRRSVNIIPSGKDKP